MNAHRARRGIRASPFVLLLALVCVLFVPAVQGMGVSPPRVEVTFQPGLQQEMSVILINNKNVPVDIDVRVEGILKGSLAVKQPIRIPAGSTTVVPLAYTLPELLPAPGYHTTFVFFTEHVPDDVGGTFAVRTEVGLQIVLWQPYPGQYAEISASAPSVPKGEDTKLKLLINNLGTDAIDGGKATVRVVDAQGLLQDVFTFAGVGVPGNSNKEFYQTIPASGYAPGKYHLRARLDYGGQVASMNGTFAVGTQDIDIIALEGPLYLDKPVNRYSVHVESLWNLPLENVYVTMVLGGTPSSTSPITLGAFERGTLYGFWETDPSILEGQAYANVTVFYPGGARSSLLPVAVYNQTPLPPQYESPSGSTFELSGADMLFIILVAIVVTALVLFVLGKRRKKDGGSGGGAGERASAVTAGTIAAASGPQSPASSTSPVPPPAPRSK